MKRNVKKLTCLSLSVACAAFIGAAIGGLNEKNVQAAVASDPSGVRVTMTDGWASSTSNGTLTVGFEQTTFASTDYFAIDMRTYEATLNGASNQYCPQILFDGKALSTAKFTIGNDWGDDYLVDYKNGGYIYLPASMSGVVYVPASLFITDSDSALSSVTFNWSNHARMMTANYYSFFKATAIGDEMTSENAIFDFDAVATDSVGTVTDSTVTYSNVKVTREVSAVGFKSYSQKEFTVSTPSDTLANTYFTATFPETEFVSGEYLAIDLKVKSAAFSGGASSNYAFQIKLNGAAMQQPSGVSKQTFGVEFGAYQRGGTGVGYFGMGIWFFMNADLDAILYIPAEKLLAGTSSANATLQTSLSSLTIDYATGNVGRQTTVAYYGIFKASAIGETMNESNCMYDFSKVETDANGAINDSSLTVAKLTAAVTETEKTEFVANMSATKARVEETYALATGEKRVEATVTNGVLDNAETLAVRFMQTERTLDSVDGLKTKIGVKFKGYTGVYALGENVKSIPAFVGASASDLTVENGYVTLTGGTDSTVYFPLNKIYQAVPRNAEIEKIIVTYTGNDFGFGEFVLRKDVNGEKVSKTLNVSIAAADDNVSIARYTAEVSASENGELVFDRNKYGAGDEANLTVTPASGYQILTLTVNGADVTDQVVDGVYAFSVEGSVTASASFMPALTEDNFYYGGASIRLKKSTDNTGDGIRFAVLIEKTLYEALTARGDVSFGTVILPEDLIPAGEALTVDTPLARLTDTEDIWTEIVVDGKTYVRSIVYLWGIPEESYSRGISARGYICVNGKYFYTAETKARSITSVAQEAYANSTDETERGRYAAYFPVVIFDGGDGEGSMQSVTLTDGVIYVLPECTIAAPAGKTFGGYLVNGETYSVGAEIWVSGTVIVTVVWS